MLDSPVRLQKSTSLTAMASGLLRSVGKAMRRPVFKALRRDVDSYILISSFSEVSAVHSKIPSSNIDSSFEHSSQPHLHREILKAKPAASRHLTVFSIKEIDRNSPPTASQMTKHCWEALLYIHSFIASTEARINSDKENGHLAAYLSFQASPLQSELKNLLLHLSVISQEAYLEKLRSMKLTDQIAPKSSCCTEQEIFARLEAVMVQLDRFLYAWSSDEKARQHVLNTQLKSMAAIHREISCLLDELESAPRNIFNRRKIQELTAEANQLFDEIQNQEMKFIKMAVFDYGFEEIRGEFTEEIQALRDKSRMYLTDSAAQAR
jgi:hypothetical protein